MKKYFIVLAHDNQEAGYTTLAANEKSARNKAVKRARFATKDKTITQENIMSVTYEGFYLARRFFPAKYEVKLP